MREQCHNYAKERAFRTVGPLVRKFSPDGHNTMGVLEKVFNKLPEERLSYRELLKETFREVKMQEENAEQRATFRKATRNLQTYSNGKKKSTKKI